MINAVVCYAIPAVPARYTFDTRCCSYAVPAHTTALVKLPQIAKIVKARSAHGLSLLAYLLETTAYCITLAYNTRHRHPFSTYGETVFVAGQNAIILALMLALRGRYLALCVMLVAGVLAQTALYGEQYVSMAVLGRLQATTIPITLASKLPQIWSNYRQGSTGQLSAITVFLFLGGSLAR